MDKLLYTALQWILDDDKNIDQDLLNQLRSIKDGKLKSPNKLVTNALGIMTGKTDPERGDYSLFLNRELYLDIYTSNEKERQKTLLALLKDDKLDVVYIPENRFDNHIGLSLRLKLEKE